MNMSISLLNNYEVRNKATDREVYLDFLRIISCCSVVFVHVISNLLRTSSNEHFTNQLLFFGSSIRWCVPVFFMISGALMLEGHKRYTWKQIINKILRRVIKPYLVWSIIYQIIYCLESESPINIVTAPIKIILGYGWYHLWYLYALIGLYICIPGLGFIWESKYGRIIAVIGSFLMVVVNTFNMLFPEYQCSLFIPIFGGYIVYLVFGALVASLDNKKVLLCCSITGLAATVVLSILTIYLPEYRNQLWDYNNILICFGSVGLVALVKLIFSYVEVNSSSILSSIAKYTFGVYLCHDLFLQLIECLLRPDSLIMGIFYGALTIIASYIFMLIIMKRHVLQKLLL